MQRKKSLPEKRHRLFRATWWGCNLLLIFSVVAAARAGVWEYTVRSYLDGFSDAIVEDSATPREKVEAILAWMRNGPPRQEALRPSELSFRDPKDTLNYRQLLAVCGSATNAFLNLARSTGVDARRLLLLSPDRTAKHVVAEVKLEGRWVIADPTYRALMQDARGNLLTRKEMQDPELFREATSRIPGYIQDYSYESSAHVRISAIPLHGLRLRPLLDRAFPGWDEYLDWSLLLERRSFMFLFLSIVALLSFLLVRLILGWLADNRLRVPRFHLRANLIRATTAFFTTPEIK
jgi:hypothetical protein